MAGKVTVGLALHWPCVTDFSGLSTYGLKAYEREMSTPPTVLVGYGTIYVFFAQVQVGNETRRTYALKQMKKYHIVETHQQEHVLNEKWSMVDARSDFIIRYRLTP